MTDPLLNQWAALGAESRFTRSEHLVRKRTQFERRIRRRNLVEYLAGGFVMVVFGWAAWLSAQAGEAVVGFGWLLGVVGMAVVLTSLYHRAGNLPPKPESDCRSHLRAQLEHQRGALASVPRWYLAPLVPGMLFVILGSALQIARDEGPAAALASAAIGTTIVAAIFAGIAWLNHRAAKALAREIAALDELD